MARPQKVTAEYFSHDTGMRNDLRIKAVRTKFSHEGYAIFNMMLEHLTACEGVKMELTDLNFELLSGDFISATETLRNVIFYCVSVKLFEIDEQNFLRCAELEKRLKPLFDKRNRAKERFEQQKSTETVVSATETSQSVVEMTQSKVKESKVKYNTIESTKVDSCPTLLDVPAIEPEKSKKEIAVLKVENEQTEIKKKYQALITAIRDMPKKDLWLSLKDFIQTNKPMFLAPYLDAWNIFAINFQLIKQNCASTTNRENKIRIRAKEQHFDFFKILESVQKSDHCKGGNNRGWKVDIDFILESESNYIKILEGRYS